MKILLTRPLEDSILTSKILREDSIKSDISPLIEIKKHKVDFNFSSIDVLIFTSKNGVRCFDLDQKIFKDNLLVFSVGTETKNIIQQKKKIKVINIDGDLSKLKKSIAKFLKEKMTIIHPTSSEENLELRDYFLKFKCKYTALKCYNSEMVNVYKDVFKKFIKYYDKGIISLYSSLTAKSFVREIRKHQLQSFCKNKKFVVISAKVKKELDELSLNEVFIANKPDERNMIKLIKNKFFLEN